MASSIKKTAVALVTILAFLNESVEGSMPLLDPVMKMAAQPKVQTFVEEDPAKFDNKSFDAAVNLVNDQIPIEPEAKRVDIPPESLTTSIEIAPIPTEIDAAA